MPDDRKKSWLENVHPDVAEKTPMWEYARDHYLADFLGDETKVAEYLIRRAQGESEEAYAERVALADYTPHFASVVDSLAGMLFNVEDNANRIFNDENGNGLGDPKDVSTFIGRLWQDADSKGTGYPTIFKQAATELIYMHRVVVAVTGGSDGNARIQLYPPTALIDYRHENGRLVEAKILDTRDVRNSIQEDPGLSERYFYFTPEGWTEYALRVDSEGNKSEDEINTGPHSFKDPTGAPILPVFYVELPLRRMVGYILARKANAIFNKESHRDHLLTVASFPKLNIIGSDDTFEKVTAALKKGSNALQNDPDNGKVHGFIAPDSGPATVNSNVLERKVDEFYRSAFREYGDSAKERTATEVRQDVASGVGAFLQLLKAAVDDIENQVLWRLAQIEFPDDRSKWFVASVERSADFLPPDIDVVIDRLRKRYFGETDPIPVGRQGLRNVVKQIADLDGIKVPAEEIEAAVDHYVAGRGLNVLREMPVPARGLATIAIRSLEALGVFDPEGPLDEAAIEEIREAAIDLAESKEEGAVRNGRAFGV